jgi:outer membrane autotransporter protein
VIGISDFGAGVDIFNNLAGGTVSSTNGAGVLANCEAFNNAGTISMVDGAANDSLSVCGDYVGSGNATLALDVDGANGELTADQLIVAGNVSGSTGINLNLLPGSAVIDTDGVMVVDAGTATGTPFALNGPTNFGLIDYALDQRGADTFLVSSPDAAIFDIATAGSLIQDMWHQSADAHLSCAASRRNDFGTTRTDTPIALCAQLYGGRDKYGDNDRSATVFGTNLSYSDRLETDRRGAQVELGFRAGTNFVVGLTGGYERAESDLASGTELVAEGHNYGAFAQYGAANGFYGALLVKRDKFDIRMSNNVLGFAAKPDARSTGVDGQVGWRTPTFGAALDVNAGLSYVKTKWDDFTAGNIAFDPDSTSSLRGRLGASLTWSGHLAPFVGAKVFHEFKDDFDLGVRSGTLDDGITGRGRGTWARLEAGLGGGAGGGPILSGWADLGDVKGWGVRAGFRF